MKTYRARLAKPIGQFRVRFLRRGRPWCTEPLDYLDATLVALAIVKVGAAMQPEIVENTTIRHDEVLADFSLAREKDLFTLTVPLTHVCFQCGKKRRTRTIVTRAARGLGIPVSRERKHADAPGRGGQESQGGPIATPAAALPHSLCAPAPLREDVSLDPAPAWLIKLGWFVIFASAAVVNLLRPLWEVRP